MAIIYETVNLYNLANGILPWRYIGSDQNNDPLYLGSNKELKKDIEKWGHANFVKTILEDCGNIKNKDLRKIESEKYLRPNKVRTDNSYYNKSETFSPGCGQKGMKHSQKFSRSEKWKKSRIGHAVSEKSRELMSQKKKNKKASILTKIKMSDARSGEKNINALRWTIISPTGEVINITSLRTWAKNNNHNFYDIYYSKNGWKTTKHGVGKGGGRKKKEKTSEC